MTTKERLRIIAECIKRNRKRDAEYAAKQKRKAQKSSDAVPEQRSKP